MENIKISAVVMASGHSKRFKGDKLMALIDGVPMIEKLFMAIPKNLFETVAVVARDENIITLAEKYGFKGVYNGDKTDDTAITIRLGMENIFPDSDGCMFFVADQPWLRGETILSLADKFREEISKICMLGYDGHKGNPVVFPKEFFGELKNLLPKEQGKTVIKRYPEQAVAQEVENPLELKDIDYFEDLKN